MVLLSNTATHFMKATDVTVTVVITSNSKLMWFGKYLNKSIKAPQQFD